jgi:hypothetical protein
VNSSGFQNQSYANPAWPTEARFQQAITFSDDAKLGDFTLTASQLSRLPASAPVTPPDSVPGLNRSGYYITNYTGSPGVGSIRVSWIGSNVTRASALAVQRGTALVNYTTKNGTQINELFAGDLTGADMVKALQTANKMAAWFLRILFAVFICIGFTMIFGPVNVLVGLIPFLGKYIGKVTNKVSQIIGGIVGVSLSLVIILVSWIVVRPLVAVPLALIIVCIVLLAKRQKKINAALPAPAADASGGAWTCSCGQTGNTGKFCAACGKPQQAGPWTCSCGQVNSGKFCAACGKPQP